MVVVVVVLVFSVVLHEMRWALKVLLSLPIFWRWSVNNIYNEVFSKFFSLFFFFFSFFGGGGVAVFCRSSWDGHWRRFFLSLSTIFIKEFSQIYFSFFFFCGGGSVGFFCFSFMMAIEFAFLSLFPLLLWEALELLRSDRCLKILCFIELYLCVQECIVTSIEIWHGGTSLVA